MRTLKSSSAILLAALSLLAFLPTGASAADQASCDAQRKVCYAGKTETGLGGSRYVPPDAVRDCEAAYRVCVAGH